MIPFVGWSLGIRHSHAFQALRVGRADRSQQCRLSPKIVYTGPGDTKVRQNSCIWGVVTWLSGLPEELILERQRNEQDQECEREDGIPFQATELPSQTRVWVAEIQDGSVLEWWYGENIPPGSRGSDTFCSRLSFQRRLCRKSSVRSRQCLLPG